MTITASDIMYDHKMGQNLISLNTQLIMMLAKHNPGVIGVFVSFMIFQAICAEAGVDPLREYMELNDALQGVTAQVAEEAKRSTH